MYTQSAPFFSLFFLFCFNTTDHQNISQDFFLVWTNNKSRNNSKSSNNSNLKVKNSSFLPYQDEDEPSKKGFLGTSTFLADK
jgi:hypothetical protein